MRYTWFFKWFWTSELFTWVVLAWSFLALVYLLCKPVERLSLDDQFKSKALNSDNKV